jgi:hypothetical protein
MSKCIICGKNEATIPDRNTPWSRKNKICKECHSDRLKHDFIFVLEVEKRKRER